MIRVLFLLFFIQLPVWSTEVLQCVHLLNRISLGVDSQNLKLCLDDVNYHSTVKRIIYNQKNINNEKVPLFTKSYLTPQRKFKSFNLTERKIFRDIRRNNKRLLKKWYFEKLLTSNDPFFEKMVLYWHNHFTSSLRKVGQAKLMYAQHKLFRHYALGNYAEFLHAIIEDPAMLIYLDNRMNKKMHPNENFARELLELFTLGEGHYSEKDIKELARGLTGYSLDKHFNFKFKKKLHDSGKKTFLNHTGKFNAHDMIDIILQQEQTSVYIVTKLWKEFVNYSPDTQEINRLAKLFRDNNYELKPLMYALLTSQHFIDKENRGTMIKSPIELIVGTLRSFEYIDFDPKVGSNLVNKLGQNLFDPPNVKGWDGGYQWIDVNTLLIRKVFLNRLLRGNTMQHLKLTLFNIPHSKKSKEVIASELLLTLDVFLKPSNQFIYTLRQILQHPIYQLK